MQLADSLSEWTEWTRLNVLPKAELPLIDDGEIDMIEQACEVWDAPSDQVRESLESFLAPHYDEVAARFVVLSFLCTLLKIEYGTFAEVERKQREGFARILKDLVRLVSLEHLADQKVVRWEIVNSCAVEDWELALRLYDRLAARGRRGRFQTA